jgi:hypothetical protein
MRAPASRNDRGEARGSTVDVSVQLVQPTNRQLRQLLVDLGFASRKSVEANCLVFEHPQSKARLLVPSNKDEEPAREADVISIRTHLIYRRHLDQAGFEHFLQAGALKAS